MAVIQARQRDRQKAKIDYEAFRAQVFAELALGEPTSLTGAITGPKIFHVSNSR